MVKDYKRALLTCCALTFATCQTTAATPVMRLLGLNRLYFKHVGGPGIPLKVPAVVAELLPLSIPISSINKARSESKTDEYTTVQVRDFGLPLHGVSREVFLRQVVMSKETERTAELWWAFYDGGRRGDVWYFTAYPTDGGGKVLSNYEIEGTVESSGGLDLKVYGEMFRPRGAWWITGKVFRFTLNGDKLSLFRVRNVFGFFHDEDTGAALPSTDVTTEQEMKAHFKTLSYDSVPQTTLSDCGFKDPLSDEYGEFNWAEMEKTAACVTDKPGAKASYRGLNEPSFIERGGRAIK